MDRKKRRLGPILLIALAAMVLIVVVLSRDAEPPKTTVVDPVLVTQTATEPIVADTVLLAAGESPAVKEPPAPVEEEPVAAPEPPPKRVKPKAKAKIEEPVAEEAAQAEITEEITGEETVPEEDAPKKKVEPSGDLPPAPGPMPPGKVELVFDERLNWLKTKSVEAIFDGKPFASRKFSEESDLKSVVLYTGTLPAGRHQLDLRVKMVGESSLFSYVEGYTFTLNQHVVVDVAGNESVRLVITAVEGNMTSDWKDRVKLEVKVRKPQPSRT